MAESEPNPGGLMTRVALLEAKVRLIVLALEGLIVVIVSALLAYFFQK
jgi:hypothetical protein